MTNVLPLRGIHLDPHNLAAAQLFRDRWLNRRDALANCVDYLLANTDTTVEHAELTALQAYADLEATNRRERIDVDATTSQLVVLRLGEGTPVGLTVTDLLQVLKQARQEQRTSVIDRHRQRPVLIDQ